MNYDEEKTCCQDLHEDQHHKWCDDDERGDWERDQQRDRRFEED